MSIQAWHFLFFGPPHLHGFYQRDRAHRFHNDGRDAIREAGFLGTHALHSLALHTYFNHLVCLSPCAVERHVAQNISAGTGGVFWAAYVRPCL